MTVEVMGPWSPATRKAFWEAFAPAAPAPAEAARELRSAFCVETARPWSASVR